MAELRAARAAGRRVPDFFLVGHAKCGTTAMWEMLSAHPQIFTPRFKEMQFLSRGSELGPPPPGRLRPRTLEAYLSLFEDADPSLRAGEASTEYLRTPGTARRIAALCPDARIVTAFREPAAFVRSLHLQLLEIKVETEPDLGRALALEERRRAGQDIPPVCQWPQALQYREHVHYAAQLREYHECFGPDRVLVLLYDEFRADNAAALRRVMRFLDIDDTVALARSEANPTVRVRSHRAGAALQALSQGRGPLTTAARGAVQALSTDRMRQRALRAARSAIVERAPHSGDPSLTNELRERFRPEVQAFGDYLGRDLLALWGYEDSSAPAGPPDVR